ncbi:MAG: LysR family transcriptional regulator [Pseudomonadota bacterium]
MDWRSVTFDWNQARAFLVTVEEGSLSAAARALGMAQPTLGRQVRALEEGLGVVLFERGGHGLVLTPSGEALVDHVRSMGEAASRISLTASGRNERIEGTVVLSMTELAAAYVMPPILADLRAVHAGIEIEVVVSNAISDLRRREADIAIRAVRPTDPDLVGRKIWTDRAHLYGAKAYLDRVGDPKNPEELAKLNHIGFRENAGYQGGLNAFGVPVTEANFPLRCADQLIQWPMIRQGLGIGVMVERIGDAEPLVRRAAPWLPPFEFDVWLVAHREVRTSRRVRIVFDHLAHALERAHRES